MAWSLVDGEITEDPDGVSWTEVIKQKRSIRSNEARVAAMYAELDAQPEWKEPEETIPESTLSPFAAQLVGLILKDEREKSLTASLSQTMDAISQRMDSDKEERTALVAALSTIGQPVINVAPADVKVDVEVPTPQVTVEAAQITVQPAEVNVPPAQITFSPEITVPTPAQNVTKTVTMERDYDGRLTQMQVTEGGE